MNIPELFELFTTKLTQQYGSEEARAVSRVYLSDKLGITGYKQLHDTSQIVAMATEELALSDLQLLITGMPVQYITGFEWFLNRKFKVDKRVLIPRPETEELVTHILGQHQNKQIHVVDIGTGSGCIPVSLKLARPQWQITATDISDGALQVAAENAQLLGADIRFLKDDILHPDAGTDDQFNLVISNPPYIPVQDAARMAQHVTQFEPHSALFVPDDDPELFYRKILEFSNTRLLKGGFIYFELNSAFAGSVLEMVQSYGFEDAVVITDISGNERFISAKKPVR